MSEEETENTENVEAAAEEATDAAAAEAPVEETPAEEAPEAAAEEAPAEEAAPEAAEEAPAEEDPLAELPWKERRRVLKSRESGPAGPERSPEQRQADREAARAKKAAVRRKRREEIKAERKGDGVGTPRAEKTRTGKPKERQGTVVSDKTDKTITVQIDTARRHPVYEKIVRQTHKIHAHDEQNEAHEGDVVRVIETRKLSKTKHWRLVEVVEKAR
ncbi:MAG: 30S ribosomal protein S17 [Solirubrobacterales bacterium]|nr:30S ribosomal protein S17 [Solirubrobacterales bacterium]